MGRMKLVIEVAAGDWDSNGGSSHASPVSDNMLINTSGRGVVQMENRNSTAMTLKTREITYIGLFVAVMAICS